MKRALFSILGVLLGAVGALARPEFLAASDTVDVAGLNPSKVVETVLVEEPEVAEPEVVEVVLAPVAGAAVAYTAPANNIQINGRAIELGWTDTTAENAGAATKAWYHSGGKFIYGHNAGNVFGFLDTAYDGGWLNGMSFTVTMNGETRSYTVANYRLYDWTGTYTLTYEGNNYGMKPIERAELLDVPTHSTTSYNMAIMTCYAGSSKRLVVFAN